jgi:hypothetical protein
MHLTTLDQIASEGVKSNLTRGVTQQNINKRPKVFFIIYIVVLGIQRTRTQSTILNKYHQPQCNTKTLGP